MLQTLVETTEFKPLEKIWESTGENTPKRMKVRGVFQKVNERNKNGRRYPLSVWEKCLSPDSKFIRNLKERKAVGQLEHPKDGVSNLRESSHLVTNVYVDGDKVMGEAVILNTPAGLILQELFSVGVPVGISSRGEGDVRIENGEEIVEDTYTPMTWDFVYDPSVEDARPSVIKENKNKIGFENMDKIAAAKIVGAAKEKIEVFSRKLNESCNTVKDCVKLNEDCRSLNSQVGPLCAIEDFAKDAAELQGRLDGIVSESNNKINKLSEEAVKDIVGEGDKIPEKGDGLHREDSHEPLGRESTSKYDYDDHDLFHLHADDGHQ